MTVAGIQANRGREQRGPPRVGDLQAGNRMWYGKESRQQVEDHRWAPTTSGGPEALVRYQDPRDKPLLTADLSSVRAAHCLAGLEARQELPCSSLG